jgi:hypothetical protein
MTDNNLVKIPSAKLLHIGDMVWFDGHKAWVTNSSDEDDIQFKMEGEAEPISAPLSDLLISAITLAARRPKAEALLSRLSEDEPAGERPWEPMASENMSQYFDDVGHELKDAILAALSAQEEDVVCNMSELGPWIERFVAARDKAGEAASLKTEDGDVDFNNEAAWKLKVDGVVCVLTMTGQGGPSVVYCLRGDETKLGAPAEGELTEDNAASGYHKLPPKKATYTVTVDGDSLTFTGPEGTATTSTHFRSKNLDLQGLKDGIFSSIGLVTDADDGLDDDDEEDEA